MRTWGSEVVKASGLPVGFRVHLAGFVYISVAFFLGLVGFVKGVDAVVSVIDTALVAGPLVVGPLENSRGDAVLYAIVLFTAT